jgi:putative SOS response-associated peptidase YedK
MCYSIQTDKNIREMAEYFEANYSSRTEEFFLSQNSKAKIPGNDNRVFKNYYAPVIINRKGKREIVPLRYNLLPGFCESDKYQFFNQQKKKYEELNTYNAKIENIERARAYENLFMNHHCVIPILSFFEWVKQDGKTKEVEFFSESKKTKYLLAGGVWDHWGPKDLDEGINSFAIITTPPRVEVEKVGHHRSPLLLKEESIDKWIRPNKNNKNEIYSLIENNYDEVLENRFLI